MARSKNKNILKQPATVAAIVAVAIIIFVLLFGSSGQTAKFYAVQKTTQVQPIKISQPIMKTACAPSAEICNLLDDDCDNKIDEGLPLHIHYLDNDRDNYGSDFAPIRNCYQAIQGFVAKGGDCNDANAAIKPGMPESCNLLDDDCDKLVDEDFDKDGDGYFDRVACAGSGVAKFDCDDSDANINDAAQEVCGDNKDNNCNGQADENCAAQQQPAPACVPSNEVCDKIDNDCDNSIDEDFDRDGDGSVNGPGCGVYYAQQDCDDLDAAKYPGNGCP